MMGLSNNYYMNESASNNTSINLFDDRIPWEFDMGGMILSIVCGEPARLNAVVVIMFIVCLIGIFGNICLLLVILCNSRLQNAANILIINVTIADLLFIFSNAPFYMKHELGKPCWMHGLLACQMRHYIPKLAKGACIFSLAALSRERFVAIVKGLESRITRSLRRTVLTTSLAWVFGVAIATPVLFLTSISAYGLQCSYLPVGKPSSEAYVMFLFLVVYLIPLGFIATHYCLIARSLCQSSVRALASNSKASVDQMRARRRLARVVLVITVFFGVFWFPHYAYNIWFMFTKHVKVIEEDGPIVRVFRYMDYYMALANSCINPWIVFIMSSVHRNTLRQFRTGVICRILRSYGSTKRSRVHENRTTEQTLLKSSGTNGFNVAVVSKM